MNNYVAKFSTGTKERNSDKVYNFAAAYINQETGKIKNITFSASPNPRPQKTGIFANTSRKAYGSYKRYKEAIRKNKELEKVWKIETIKL